VRPVERRADLVYAVVRRGAPVLGLVVEVQLRRVEAKKARWLLYAASVWARLKVPTYVVVVTPHPGVAAWAAVPLPLGPPGASFRPFVIGPAAIPRVVTAAAARAAPELAVLSALAHARGPDGLAVVPAVLRGLEALDDERAESYIDYVLSQLPARLRRSLEKQKMAIPGYQFQSPIARKWVAKGEAQGEAKGRAEALLAVLQARGLRVTAADRTRIRKTTDLARLDEWIRRAVTAASVRELLA
jgi:hypothetical protein